MGFEKVPTRVSHLAVNIFLNKFRLDAVQDIMNHPTFEATFTSITKGLPDYYGATRIQNICACFKCTVIKKISFYLPCTTANQVPNRFDYLAWVSMTSRLIHSRESEFACLLLFVQKPIFGRVVNAMFAPPAPLLAPHINKKLSPLGWWRNNKLYYAPRAPTLTLLRSSPPNI